MVTETVQVENVEQVAPAQEVSAEKVEIIANGDHKAENGNGNGCADHVAEAAPNGEAPNAESTPIKNKAKRRAIVANVRAAFQRLGLMSQLRAIGRRMKRNPKQKQCQEPAAAEQAQNGEAEKVQENGNGLLDGAALLASTTPAADEQVKCNGNGHAAHDEAAPECNGNAGEDQTSAPVVETQNNETTEQTAVVAQ